MDHTAIGWQQHDPVRPIRARSIVTVAALCGQIIVSLTLLAAYGQRLVHLMHIRSGVYVEYADVAANDTLIRSLALVSVAAPIVVAVAFLVWFYRAHQNLSAFRTAPLQYSPGMAVGFFFIPLANFVLPYLVMREVWRASDPDVRPFLHADHRAAKGGWLVPVWWLFYLARIVPSVAMTLTAGLSETSVGSLLRTTYWALGFYGLSIVAAVVTVVLVLGVERRQAACARGLVAERRAWADQMYAGWQVARQPEPG